MVAPLNEARINLLTLKVLIVGDIAEILRV